MKKSLGIIVAAGIAISACNHSPPIADSSNRIADHAIVDELRLGRLSESDIEHAKSSLRIAYGHTSHGSQITEGMTGLVAFANAGKLGTDYSADLFAWNGTGDGGALQLRDFYGSFGGSSADDLGAPDREAWAAATRVYLADNPEIDVVMWSWCGEVDGTEEEIASYLSLMSGLEADFPDAAFVYMTGHLNGTGTEGNVNRRNEQIRAYCEANGKWLYDFADIESYDPDGICYLDRYADDGCNYDEDGDGTLDSNWATAWQAAHAENEQWYECGAAHSLPVNSNMKAYAAWWLFARIAEER